ncbi:TlpA family protein disulfide reductase [Desulfobacula toluolica]|uniref:Redoxin n=1 Tax=Desulfobacula toluolica (strain DSM 7467 / Tol2) TaxID=651182 RepID=K0NJS8_DESTT|nr:TlpA disulfide reductase family protein [Desulfobacula toluolica]CCK81095.1 redoxin [Desulfobacula toluolica Tol2]
MFMVCRKNKICVFLILVLFFALQPQNVFCGTPPKQGEKLPEMSLTAPVSKNDSAYLGIGEKSLFLIQDIDAAVIVLEIIGVYCPVCHKQRPHINRLFHRISKNADLSGKIKFLGISAGATPMEVAYYMKTSRVPYPVLPDEKFNAHKKLNQPLTPYTIVVTKDGQIRYAHLGLIQDMDGLFATLKQLADKTPVIKK